MTPENFVAKCSDMGVRLSVLSTESEPIIRAKFPPGVQPPPRFVETLKAHKPAIINTLLLLTPLAAPDPEYTYQNPPPFVHFAELLALAEQGLLPVATVRLGPGVTVPDPNNFVILSVERAAKIKRRMADEADTTHQTENWVQNALLTIRRDLFIIESKLFESKSER